MVVSVVVSVARCIWPSSNEFIHHSAGRPLQSAVLGEREVAATQLVGDTNVLHTLDSSFYIIRVFYK